MNQKLRWENKDPQLEQEAQKILFLLEDQQDGVFEIREAVQV